MLKLKRLFVWPPTVCISIFARSSFKHNCFSFLACFWKAAWCCLCSFSQFFFFNINGFIWQQMSLASYLSLRNNCFRSGFTHSGIYFIAYLFVCSPIWFKVDKSFTMLLTSTELFFWNNCQHSKKQDETLILVHWDNVGILMMRFGPGLLRT